MEWSSVDLLWTYEVQLGGIMPFAPEIRKGEYVFPVFTDKVRCMEQVKNEPSTQYVTSSHQAHHHRDVPSGHQCLQRSDSNDSRTSKLAEASVFVLRVSNERSGKSELVTQPPSTSRKDVIGPWNRQWVSINSSYYHPRPSDDH
ncbi:uncharacterized protein LOC124259146 [Haliotis rubra]|uniref:uncharacterized protein LOC124259146 n=1 Tax=Haliotis rubra TaxID=36100 RepID=UPI001EE5D49C|nr:uncharacterized protein LOC124259146 [Haliotis rubra]